MNTPTPKIENSSDKSSEKSPRDEMDEQPDEQPDKQPENLPRSLGAELLGTFILTLVDCGAVVIHHVSGEGSYAARAVAPGLTVMAMIYSLGQISGAHINPAATLAFTLRGVFAWNRLPLYWLAQILGATVAALWLRVLFGPVQDLGAPQPHHGLMTSFGMEFTLTFLLVTVILSTATRQKTVGPEAAIAVGATVALCNLFARPISGAVMNPARALGPALVSSDLGTIWIYLVAPLIGATLAAFVAHLIHGPVKPEEKEAACGEQGKSEKQPEKSPPLAGQPAAAR